MSYRFKFLMLLCVLSLLLAACGKSIGALPQSNLEKPSAIIVMKGDQERRLDLEEEAYTRIYEAISKNWWKDGSTGKEYDNKKGIPKTQALSDQEFIDSFSVKIVFEYAEKIEWYDYADTKETLQCIKYIFLIPEKTSSDTAGEFLMMENDDAIGSSNRYEYYYNEEIFDILDRLK